MAMPGITLRPPTVRNVDANAGLGGEHVLRERPMTMGAAAKWSTIDTYCETSRWSPRWAAGR